MVTSISLPIFAAPSTPSAIVQPTCEAVSFYTEDDISQTEKTQRNACPEGKIRLNRILELIVKLRAMLENLFKSKNEKERVELPRQQVITTKKLWQDLEDEIKSLTIDDTSLIDEIDEFLVKEINELQVKIAETNEAPTILALEDSLSQDMENDLQAVERARQMSLNFLESIRMELIESASPVNSTEVNDEDYYDSQTKFLADLIDQAHQTLARPVSLATAGAMLA